MSGVPAIEALQLSAAPAILVSSSPPTAPETNFESWLTGRLSETDASIKTADTAVQDLALGRTENLHDVMINLERARMSLSLVVQVRNRLLESYQEIMRMQV